MIDYEDIVYDTVSDELKAVFPGIGVSSGYTDAPSKFPFVTVMETSNEVYERTSTSRQIENNAQVLYEVNVFSNLVGYTKIEAKRIMAVVDAEFAKMGFTRIMCSPTPNLADARIYRITARYSGVVDRGRTVYTK